MKFDRVKNNQLINYYEYFLKYRESISTGIPFMVCDWYLLVGLGPSAIDYPDAVPGVCQRSCPLISRGVSDFRDAHVCFGIEPDGSGGLPVAGFA